MEKFTLHSGGAYGADEHFDKIGREFGLTKINHYYYSPTPFGNYKITDDQLEEGYQKVLLANETLKRRPEKHKKLLSRNYFQVKNATSVFAVAPLKNNVVLGGTGWAVQMAIDSGDKEVFVFNLLDNKWYKYSNEFSCFITTNYPVLSTDFAGIGSRKITQEGIDAIRELYENTVTVENWYKEAFLTFEQARDLDEYYKNIGD